MESVRGFFRKPAVAVVFWTVLTVLGLAAFAYLKASIGVLIFLGILFVLASVMHILKGKRSPDHLVDVLGIGEERRGNIPEYDHLRLIAVLLVIAAHFIQPDLVMEGVVKNDTARAILDVLYIYSLICNVLYVMLSGALLLPYREEKLSHFFVKRLGKVLLPMFIYFLIYRWYNGYLPDLSWSTLCTTMERFVGANNAESPHMWLIYVIVSLYLVFPFFRYMMKDLPYRSLCCLVGISLVFMGITSLSPVYFYFETFMAEWIGVAVIGYWVTREETRKYYKPLMIIGAVCAVVIAVIVLGGGDYKGRVVNTSPFAVLLTAGVIAGVFSAHRLFGHTNTLLRVFSRYSYSIILVHWAVLYYVTKMGMGLTCATWHGLGLPVGILVTLFASLLAGIIVDNLIVEPIKEGLSLCAALVKKLFSKKAS